MAMGVSNVYLKTFHCIQQLFLKKNKNKNKSKKCIHGHFPHPENSELNKIHTVNQVFITSVPTSTSCHNGK